MRRSRGGDSEATQQTKTEKTLLELTRREALLINLYSMLRKPHRPFVGHQIKSFLFFTWKNLTNCKSKRTVKYTLTPKNDKKTARMSRLKYSTVLMSIERGLREGEAPNCAANVTCLTRSSRGEKGLAARRAATSTQRALILE